MHHERTVRQVVEPRDVVALRTGVAIDPFQMEPCVDRVGASRSRMDPAPDRGEPIVVISAAERAGPMSRGEGGRLIEEEQLGEPSGLHQGGDASHGT